MNEKSNQHKQSGEKVAIRCAVCKRRLFDFVSGEFVIEIKCARCRKINTIQCISSWTPAKNRKENVPYYNNKKRDSLYGTPVNGSL